MARPTYNARGIVVRKTKLGEMDLIVTLLAQDGSQIRAVANGGRKPGGAFAGKLELCNTVDVLCSEGKSLDTIKEARIVTSRTSFARDIQRSNAAMVIAELVERTTQPDLTHEKLFHMIDASFDALAQSKGAAILYVCAAALLKTFAFTGVMPQFEQCASCGTPLAFDGAFMHVSTQEGGIVCSVCAQQTETQGIAAGTVQLASSLLRARFDAIRITPADRKAALAVLELCYDWARFHVGARLKSLDLLITWDEIPCSNIE